MNEETLGVLYDGYREYCTAKGYLRCATKSEIRVWEDYKGILRNRIEKKWNNEETKPVAKG